jgi:SagB-type dehydrogenase family enzyme
MDFADRFILRPARSQAQGPAHVAAVLEEADAQAAEAAEPLYELFHEQTKIRRFNYTQQLESRADRRIQARIRYNNAKDFEGFPWVELPAPSTDQQKPLASQRQAPDAGGFLSALANCLHLACGAMPPSREDKETGDYRANYSVEQLYPVDVYVLALRAPGLDQGAYYYHAPSHRLYRNLSSRVDDPLAGGGLAETLLKQSAVVIACVGAFKRSAWRFGERGYRYTLIECGILVERLCSTAEHHGLGAQRVPAFVDDNINRLLDLNGVDEAVLFLVSLHPA